MYPCRYYEGKASVPARWVPRTSDKWYEIIGARPMDGAGGLSISVSAQKEYRGRLVARLIYTAYAEQFIEVEIPRSYTIWIPGERVIVQARFENPIDVGGEDDPQPDPVQIEVGATVREALMAPNQHLYRSFSFVDPEPGDGTIRFALPHGVFSVSGVRSSYETAGNAPIPSVGYIRDPAGVPPADFQSLVDLERYFTSSVTPWTVTVPAAADLLQVLPGTDPSDESVYTILFGIQP